MTDELKGAIAEFELKRHYGRISRIWKRKIVTSNKNFRDKIVIKTREALENSEK